MAAATARIRDRVSFVFAYAPYSSMWTLAKDIASSSHSGDSRVVGSAGQMRESWQVDPLTRKVYVRAMTSLLEPAEAQLLRNAYTEQGGDVAVNDRELSENGKAIYLLLTHLDAAEAEVALKQLPNDMRERLDTISPVRYVKEIHAPLVIFCHDSGDKVVPVGESRRLYSAFSGRTGVHYTEMSFQHLDPSKLPLFSMLKGLGKFYLTVYPLFRRAVAY